VLNSIQTFFFSFYFSQDISARRKVTNLNLTLRQMINPSNVVKILTDRALNLRPQIVSTTSSATTTTRNREREVADLLYGVLESLVNSHSHSVDVETTLDHGLDDNEIINETADENDEMEDSFDPDYLGEEEDDEVTLCKKFSLEYMTRAVNFYDEINPKTGQRKRRWSTVKHYFKRIPHQKYIGRFRRYLEKHGTKKQKLDRIDDYVFDIFERARGNALPVHEIDLRRWALKKAMDESLHDFAASNHWLDTFKRRHNIISRKVTKVK